MMRFSACLLVVLLALLDGCGDPALERTPCAQVPGSCLALTLGGEGRLDLIEFSAALRNGEVRKGTNADGACALPCLIQVVPPPGVRSGDIAALDIRIFGDSRFLREERVPMDWPDGAHIAVAYYVGKLP